MTTKLKVPKSIDEFPDTMLASGDDTGLDVPSRIVPDALLRSRLALAGEVKLDADEVAYFKSCIDHAGQIECRNDEDCDHCHMLDILNSKLSEAEDET